MEDDLKKGCFNVIITAVNNNKRQREERWAYEGIRASGEAER